MEMRNTLFLIILLSPTLVAFGDVASSQAAANQAISDADYTKAFEELRLALDEEPGNAYSHYLLALAQIDSRRDLDEAGRHLDLAAELGAQAQPVQILRARLYAVGGDDESALAEIQSLADAGFAQLSRIEDEADFRSLHADERFIRALDKVRAARFPCEANTRHHDFNFWVGDWDVYNNGVLAGENRISSILGSCLVFEQWTSASGSEGKSFNYYDPGKDHWRQIWISDSGSIIEFTGHARDGGIFYTAETSNPATGAVTHHRFEFTQYENGDVRQFWAISSDKEEWSTIWDARYKRKE